MRNAIAALFALTITLACSAEVEPARPEIDCKKSTVGLMLVISPLTEIDDCVPMTNEHGEGNLFCCPQGTYIPGLDGPFE